jgi:hypothetical protein
MITGKLYNWLKYLAQIALPALGTLYFTVASIWHIAGADKVVGTIMAVDAALGVLLGISQVNYNKQIANAGELHVDNENQMKFVLDSDKTDVDALGDKQEVRFKVRKGSKKNVDAGS